MRAHKSLGGLSVQAGGHPSRVEVLGPVELASPAGPVDFDALHEYYPPENGEPILNRGFQNWNSLVLNMSAWLEGREVIAEF